MNPFGGWAADGVVGVFALRATIGLGRLSPGIEMTLGQWDAALRKKGFLCQLRPEGKSAHCHTNNNSWLRLVTVHEEAEVVIMNVEVRTEVAR